MRHDETRSIVWPCITYRFYSEHTQVLGPTRTDRSVLSVVSPLGTGHDRPGRYAKNKLLALLAPSILYCCTNSHVEHAGVVVSLFEHSTFVVKYTCTNFSFCVCVCVQVK